MKTPFFSVVIPLYNKERHIKRTLDSVLEQSFSDFEIIIINDGSTDDSLNIVEAFTDERIRVHSIENSGVSHARNYGIEKSNSEFIAFIDADDVWKAHHLEDLKALIENFPNCGMYTKAYVRSYKNLDITSSYNTIPKDTHWRGILEDYFKASMTNSIALTSAVLLTKTAWKHVGGFNTAFDSGEDTDLWIRTALKYDVAFDNKVSVVHYLDSDNKLTYKKLSDKTHASFSDYVEETTNDSLKAYLDLNRYAVGMQYKIEGHKQMANTYIEAIDVNNLSSAKRLSLKLPGFVLRLILGLRNGLRNLGFNLSLFR